MNYEIVELSEKTVVGLSARTSNSAPDMHQTISGLWNDFYGKGVYSSISAKTTGKALEIYADYECDRRVYNNGRL